MEINTAITALSSLAHPSRLQAFRRLVRAGPGGLAAGELSAELGLAAPTMSFHLAQLVRAGLLISRRTGRSIRYSLRPVGIQELLEFVTEDCCQGRPELCAPRFAAPAGPKGCGPCD